MTVAHRTTQLRITITDLKDGVPTGRHKKSEVTLWTEYDEERVEEFISVVSSAMVKYCHRRW